MSRTEKLFDFLLLLRVAYDASIEEIEKIISGEYSFSRTSPKVSEMAKNLRAQKN